MTNENPKYEESETPTRPDLPGTVAAPKCVHCQRVYGEHAQTAKTVEPTLKCGGIRKGFEAGPIPNVEQR